MTDPKLEVSVMQYAAGGATQSWTITGRIHLRLIEADHAHPNAIEITIPGACAVVPYRDLVKAVEWLKRCEP